MAEKPKAVRPKAKTPKLEDKEQSERFIETARKLDVDESGKRFEKAVGRVLTPKPR